MCVQVESHGGLGHTVWDADCASGGRVPRLPLRVSAHLGPADVLQAGQAAIRRGGTLQETRL